MKHLLGLNGVRALSVLAVVWHHSRPASADWPGSGNGFLGVDVFFVLSGFLITALLLEERQTEGKVSLSGFYWRRFLILLCYKIKALFELLQAICEL